MRKRQRQKERQRERQTKRERDRQIDRPAHTTLLMFVCFALARRHGSSEAPGQVQALVPEDMKVEKHFSCPSTFPRVSMSRRLPRRRRCVRALLCCTMSPSTQPPFPFPVILLLLALRSFFLLHPLVFVFCFLPTEVAKS